MSDEDSSTDDSQKTEEPSARKLEDAHKRGQVVNSREVNNWMVLFAATLLMITAGGMIFDSLKDLFRNYIEQIHTIPADHRGIGGAMGELFSRVGGTLVFPLLAISIAGAAAGFIQTGPLFTFEPLKPALSKISIIKGFTRLFSKRSLVELCKGIVKIAVVSTAVYIVLRPYFDGVDHFVGLDMSQALFELKYLLTRMMIAVLSVLFVLAAADYLYQRMDFMKNMRMSMQELKDEYKQTEGDPLVKGKLRSLREQKARQRMMQAVPTADVVITNPTHYAVALKYHPLEMNAPVMVAKGVDAVAERIKEIARENDVSIVENPTLARALHGAMDIDEAIPPEQYKAVAEVISYVFKLKGKKM